MALKIISPATNGAGRRKCRSWIESFVDYTENLESALIFRKWAAITTIAATLEQKVWLMTSAPMFPNLYVFLIGRPGVGKTRTISKANQFYMELPEAMIAPTSMSAASMVDALLASKRCVQNLPNPMLEYNSMYIMADELSAFMHEYDNEIIGNLTTFYDVGMLPYGHNRRGKDIKIKIKHPQINILCGSTPSNLMKFVPEVAWDQGFTSRIILIFSDEEIDGDDFKHKYQPLPENMLHDLKAMNALVGEFNVTEEYQTAIRNWRALKQPPIPEHPRLTHYNTRRRAHIYKLSMVASVDRGDDLTLTKDDFNTAFGWLIEAEAFMPGIFEAGLVSTDSRAMDEGYHLVEQAGEKGLNEQRLVRFIRERVRTQDVLRTIEVMEKSGMIKATFMDPRTGLRNFIALPRQSN